MYDVNQVFGVEAKVEVAVMPGVTMSKDVSGVVGEPTHTASR